MELIRADDRFWARKVKTNIDRIKNAINKLRSEYLKDGSIAITKFTTALLTWLNATHLPGRVRPELTNNMPYMASEVGIKYTEGENIVPWPHKWISGTSSIEYDLELKEIRFFQGTTLFKKATSTGWV